MYLFFLEEPYPVTSNSFAITCINVSLTMLHAEKHTFPLLWLFKSQWWLFDFLRCVTRKRVTREFISAQAHLRAQKTWSLRWPEQQVGTRYDICATSSVVLWIVPEMTRPKESDYLTQVTLPVHDTQAFLFLFYVFRFVTHKSAF